MNVLVIGKKNHIPWAYYTARGLKQNNINTYLFYYNEYTFIDRINQVLRKEDFIFNRFYHLLKTFKPDIIVFVSTFFIPKEYFYIAKELHIKTIGWVGDVFDIDKQDYASYIDKLYVFDSSLVPLANRLGYNSELLQVGYDPHLHKNYLKNNRRYSINFIGSHTKEREALLSHLHNFNLELYGKKWGNLNLTPPNWLVINKNIDYKRLVSIYNSTYISINISQSNNVCNGITMRVFETIACGSCLISDNLKDIPLSFEPNKEILIYDSPMELISILDRLMIDKNYLLNIVENASLRLKKNDYSYSARTKYMIKMMGS